VNLITTPWRLVRCRPVIVFHRQALPSLACAEKYAEWVSFHLSQAFMCSSVYAGSGTTQTAIAGTRPQTDYLKNRDFTPTIGSHRFDAIGDWGG